MVMWDPEYSDSVLSGKSRDEMCPYRPTRANSAGGAPRRVTKDAVGITQMVCVIKEYIVTIYSLASSRPLAEFLAVGLLITVLSLQLGTSF